MQLSDNMRGAFFMMLSVVAFAVFAIFQLAVLRSVPLFQATMIQGATATVLLLAIVAFRREMSFDLSNKDWMMVALRSCTETGAIIGYLYALKYLWVGNVLFALQLAPLIITFSVSGILKENVRGKHYVMLALGLAATLFVLQPTGVPSEGLDNYLLIAKAFGLWTAIKSIFFDHFSIYVVFAIIPLGFIVLRDVATRNLSQKAGSSIVALITAGAMTMTGAIGTMSAGWSNFDPIDLIPLAISGTLLVGVFLFGIMAMRLGEVGVVQYYRHFAPVIAVSIGLVLFGEQFSGQVLVGCLVIVGIGACGLLTRKPL
jgi:drug/metabolite transporter (DMT)-like permease